MFNILSHKSPLKNIFTCALALLFSITAIAQKEEDDSPITFDSIYSSADSITVSSTDSESQKFDSLTPGSSPSYHPYSISQNKLNELRKDEAF